MEINIDIEEECPICFNSIEDNDAYLLLSCCNKRVHITCLDRWYNNGNKNKLCFLCTKNCKDIENIIVKSPIIEQRNRILINNTINDNNYKYIFCCFIIIILCSLALIFITIKVF